MLAAAFFSLTIPLGLDRYMAVPSNNPLSRASIERGRALFFDTRLSADGAHSRALRATTRHAAFLTRVPWQSGSAVGSEGEMHARSRTRSPTSFVRFPLATPVSIDSRTVIATP
jgi:cytochrome c peroxidase